MGNIIINHITQSMLNVMKNLKKIIVNQISIIQN